MTRAWASEQRPERPLVGEEVQSHSSRDRERKGHSLITLPKGTAGPDIEYRTWLGHTQSCATCRAGASCPTAVRLGRAWREARRG